MSVLVPSFLSAEGCNVVALGLGWVSGEVRRVATYPFDSVGSRRGWDPGRALCGCALDTVVQFLPLSILEKKKKEILLGSRFIPLPTALVPLDRFRRTRSLTADRAGRTRTRRRF